MPARIDTTNLSSCLFSSIRMIIANARILLVCYNALMTKRATVTLLLTDLLQRECLQRDIYETYGYYLSGRSSPAIFEHLKGHLQEEQLHIDTIQRYLMGFGVPPVTTRAKIPVIEPVTLDAILEVNFELEKEAVEIYSEAIELLEGDKEYTSLRVDLEDILKQEQEHTHDLIQWLGNWRDQNET